MLIVPSNVAAPTALTIRFRSPVFGPDLSAVTAVVAGLLRRDGTSTSLTFAIVSATTRELVAQYTFTGGGEITSTGAYYLAPRLTFQGGAIPSETIPLFVAGPYSAAPQLEQDAWMLATVPMPSAGPIRHTWVDVDESITASPYGPHMALDLSASPISVTLWTALDGDVATFTDVYNEAGSNAFTLTGAAGQEVPVGDGSYDSTAEYSTPGFVLRLRFSASHGAWIPA